MVDITKTQMENKTSDGTVKQNPQLHDDAYVACDGHFRISIISTNQFKMNFFVCLNDSN